MRSQIEEFAKKMEEAVDATKTEVENRLQTIYTYEQELQQKETQGILNLKEHQIKSLEAKIKEMESQVKEAAAKVDTSEKTVKDIALKAIENASKPQVIERERMKE